MNTLKNTIQLIGRLGNDPEITIFDSGKKVAQFSLATNETYTNAAGEKATETQWHTIVAWGTTGELVSKLLTKGDQVALCGKLTYRMYEKDGQNHKVAEILLNEFYKTSKNEAPE